MRVREYTNYACDFETTVFDNQSYTEVWACGMCELYTDNYNLFQSFDTWFEYILTLPGNLKIYFHNLKFDGSFILWNIKERYTFFKEAIDKDLSQIENDYITYELIEDKYMKNNTYKYLISNRGIWYSITIKQNNRYIVFWDSLKLLPFSLAEIGKALKTKHQKLDMEYRGLRYANCYISAKEKEYIKNDVYVLKEALEFMFDRGHKFMTIGSCCMDEFVQTMGKEDFEKYFPDLYSVDIPLQDFKSLGDYIRRTYKGAWCYKKEGINQIDSGFVLDVNSLYPSVMHSKSGNIYPVGYGRFVEGDFINSVKPNEYYFVRIRCRFYLKKGKLPTVQIKGNWLYKGTEWLKTSDIYKPKTGKYSRYYSDFEENKKDSAVILSLTMTDFETLKEHYILKDLEILDGVIFEGKIGLFDAYIDPHYSEKSKSTGAIRTEQKLFLNNLYGKFATSEDSSFKVAYIKESQELGFTYQEEFNKKGGYIPVGSAITSYARNFTIKHAQANYDIFCYADTDSLHCKGNAENVKMCVIDDKELLCWKLETIFDEAIFVRQKTYIEHVISEGKPFYNVTCAGLPKNCKELFLKSCEYRKMKLHEKINFKSEKYFSKLSPTEKMYILKGHEISDFKRGLEVPSKLKPKQIKGGCLLVETVFTMR